MSEWHVKKAARSLIPGDVFVFEDALGGEGEHLTVESTAHLLGSIEVGVEELDFTVMLATQTMVTMVVD